MRAEVSLILLHLFQRASHALMLAAPYLRLTATIEAICGSGATAIVADNHPEFHSGTSESVLAEAWFQVHRRRRGTIVW